ncbi:hypothetical protein C9374_004690 [Naegleria lovaniensis]|uniref:Pre-rRNA-processing protein Ipi1 N-terminal domain-containing protein n=1 Tax=Naegleria lovaniensis TaxID=51637 RepID=A0AA88GSH9_NAELO|nr:uncharacterized protein C9374_004690 [Naegleria lovaniensis]KAG2383353.1 hypothetical protein C9374_004690 [Naegleria lovaniensis]
MTQKRKNEKQAPKKKKLGKKLKPVNQTNIEFKTKGIFMAHQNLRSVDTLESNWVTSRNLGLNDIFPKLKHYNVKTVVSAMKSLLELVTLHPVVLKVYLGKILNEVTPLMLDGNEDVHNALFNFLNYSLSRISSASITPFISLLMAYITSGMTHLIGTVRRYSLKILSKFLEHFPVPIAQYSVRVMPNICYIFMLSRMGVAYKGARYRTTQQLCVTVLNNFLSILFENNKLGIPSSKRVSHTHTHNHMKMNLVNANGSSSSSSTNSLYFAHASTSEKAQFSFDLIAQNKIQLMTQLLTRKMATLENMEQKSLKLDADQLLELGNDNSKDQEEQHDNKPTEQPSLKKLLQEEMDIKIYNLEDEESIAEFFKLIFKILVEVWIEIFEEQRASAASHHIQTEYVLTIIKSVLDISYQLLYAFEHTQQGAPESKNIHRKTINKALKQSIQHFVTKMPLQLSSKIRQSSNNIDRTNASLLAMLSFCFGRFSSEKGSTEISYKEWELVYVKQITHFISNAENLNLEDEDFAKLLGSFYRIYRYLPPAIGAQLWKSLTALFIKQGAYSSKQKLILEFFASVGLQDEAITPQAEVIEQWVSVLIPMLCKLDDEQHYEISQHILQVLLALAKNPKFQSYIQKTIVESIAPFFYNEETQRCGPFVRLPKRLQSLSLQLIYYFESLSADLMKQISKACCNVEQRLDFDLITQVIEVIRHHTTKSEKRFKLKPSVHISFLCTLLCFVCSNHGNNGSTTSHVGLVGIGDVIQEIVVSLQDYSSTCFEIMAPFLKSTLEKQLKVEKMNMTLVGALLLISSKCMQWSKLNDSPSHNDQSTTMLSELLNVLLPKILISFLKNTLLLHKRTRSSSVIVKDLLTNYHPLFGKVIHELQTQSSKLEIDFILDIIHSCLKVALPYYFEEEIKSNFRNEEQTITNNVGPKRVEHVIQQLHEQITTLFKRSEFSDSTHSTKKNQILGLLKMNK